MNLVPSIGIIDYGAGNLRSVYRAFVCLGVGARIFSDPSDARFFSHLVLPGVGSYRHAMQCIRDRGIDQLLNERVSAGVPLLGICLGMQLLSSRGSEDGETQGLGFVDGGVDRFMFDPLASALKIPHVGFNSVQTLSSSRLFVGLGESADFYFTHSFRLQCCRSSVVVGTAWHGEPFVAAVEQGVVAGTQFHPEKSQANGLRVLANFVQKF